MKTDKRKQKPAYNAVEFFILQQSLQMIFGVQPQPKRTQPAQPETIDIPYEEIKEPKQIQ